MCVNESALKLHPLERLKGESEQPKRWGLSICPGQWIFAGQAGPFRS